MRTGTSGRLALVLLAGAVTWSLVGAARRRRARMLGSAARGPKHDRVIIDGAKPADPIALHGRPGEETKSPTSRLESESEVDVFVIRERW